VDPAGKKHYPLKAYHIKRLITHVEKGGVWKVIRAYQK
jgi:hypothetical protein